MAGWELGRRIRAAAVAFRRPSATSEKRLAQVLLAAPAVIYAARWDAAMTVTFISPNIRDMTGHSPKDFFDVPGFWRSHLHPDDIAVIEASRPLLLERGQISLKYRFRHADGGYRWTRDEIKLIRGEDGEPLELLGAWLDITEHRQSEEALAASEEQLRTAERLLADALESSDDAFSLFDPEDRLLRFNRRYRDLYPTISDMIRPGVTFAELLRASALRGQYDGVTPAGAEEWVRDRLTCHAAATGAFEQKLSDGRYLEIVERRTADGGRVAIRRDVSPRKRIEEALRRELAFEQTLIDALPLPVFFKSCDGRYLGCNAKFTEALGLPMDKIVGRTLHEVMTPEKAEEYARADREILDNPSVIQRYETTMKWGDGSIRRLNVFKGTFRSADGAIAGFIGSLIDVTQQKRAEEQLVQAAKLATLGQIASEVAHELNQPLFIIRMSAETCLQGHGDGTLAPERLENKLSTICGQVARMSEMVDHLRSFSRTESGEKRSFALAPVVQSAARLLSPHFQLDGIALVTDLDAACPDVSGYPNQIEQVVLNLLTNARDSVRAHCPTGQGRVELSLKAEDGWARLTIMDNGGGIPAPLWQTVFEPFFTTKAEGAGTGLGLSISANIVAGMAGHIRGCNVGDGACFTVSLPLNRPTGSSDDQPEPTPPPAICAPAPVQGAPRGRILVVDDEALAVECLAEFLQGRGFEVITATGPGPALELAREHRLDLVITDIRMPGMEGAALLERLRSRLPDLPAILMTGGPVPADTAIAGSVILPKPLALDQLANEVDMLLARRKPTTAPNREPSAPTNPAALADLRTARMCRLWQIGEMTAALGHDFSQPLNVVRLTAEAALDTLDRNRADPDRIRRSLNAAVDQTRRMQSMIDSLLAGTRRPSEPPRPVPPVEVVRHALSQALPRLRDQSIRLIWHADLATPAVAGHAERLEMAITNLLTNAADALTALALLGDNAIPAVLRVSCRGDKDGVLIVVEDNGPGFPSDLKAALELPQATPGIGLTVCLGIIAEMDGSVSFDDASPGTRVIIRLPVAPNRAGVN